MLKLNVDWIKNLRNGSISMNKIMIEMVDEQIDAIVVQEIKNCIKGFERDLELRKEGKGLVIFDNDPVVDMMYIEKYIDGCRLVLEYHGN